MTVSEKKDLLLERLSELPLVEYGFLKEEEVQFFERIRMVCKQECPRYGSSWACPPAVGTVDECRERCGAYSDFFVFSTMAEVSDIANFEETLSTRRGHEAVTRKIREIFREIYGDCIVLSTESCELCDECTYPHAACRQPEKMLPCVESYGIVVTDLAEKAGMSYMQDYQSVIWFSAVFYNADGNKNNL